MLKRPWLTKEVWGWTCFDFANQSFTMVILTVMFQVYFVQHIVPPGALPDGKPDLSRGLLLWSQAGTIAKFLIILTSPILGALADFTGAKKRLLFFTYVISVGLTLSLGLVPPGAVAAGMILFVASNFFYCWGDNLLSAFLPELADHRDMGKVSAFSWSIAYVGALISLAVAVLITNHWPESTGLRLTSIWAGVFFLAAGIPTFILLKERKQPEKLAPGETLLTVGFHRLASTFREIRRYRWLFRFIVIMTIYNCGTQVVYWFAASITKEFGFSDREMGLFMLQVNVTAIIGAVLTGRYQDRIGTRNTILVMLGFWAVTILAVAFTTSETMFWIVGNGVGIGIGGLGTATRVMVGLFSPAQKAGEFFGFYGLANNLAAIIGVTAFGWTQALLGPHLFSVAVGLNAIYFVVGLVLVAFFIDEKAGRIAALRTARDIDRRLKAEARNGAPAPEATTVVTVISSEPIAAQPPVAVAMEEPNIGSPLPNASTSIAPGNDGAQPSGAVETRRIVDSTSSVSSIPATLSTEACPPSTSTTTPPPVPPTPSSRP